MKKKALITIGILLITVLIFFTGSGFVKNPSVFIDDYTVSEDGKEITVRIGVSSSAGYVRKVSVHQQQGGKLYLDCYSAFGGINGSIGARSVFSLRLNEDTSVIAIYRGASCYEEVLRKTEDGSWQRVKQ